MRRLWDWLAPKLDTNNIAWVVIKNDAPQDEPDTREKNLAKILRPIEQFGIANRYRLIVVMNRVTRHILNESLPYDPYILDCDLLRMYGVDTVVDNNHPDYIVTVRTRDNDDYIATVELESVLPMPSVDAGTSTSIR